MNIKNIFSLSLISLTMLANSALASKLPEDIWNYVKSNIPQAQQRFDSVVIVNDDLLYIPLYPPAQKDVEQINIEYSYPNNQTFAQYPEVILLNNGYSFLKVFKDESGNYTLTKKDDLPIKVRLGLMPQDMLTPIGLKMPESLKLTLGDLLIPTKEEKTLTLKEDEKENQKNSNPFNQIAKRNEFIPTVEFQNKKTFINFKDTKFLSVYDNTSKTPLYELKLSSMPLKIVSSEKSKVALVLYWSGKNLEIIDLKDERVITTIPIDANATDVVLDEEKNIAYVTSQNAKSIYLIDLNQMELKKVIKLDQKPSKITYCKIDDTISFFDEYSAKVFNITRGSDDYTVQPIGNASNVSKVLSDVANIYALSRTNNELYVYDKVQGTLLNTIEVDKKPIDALIYGTKIFILCAKDGYMDVYDTVEGKIISREKLSKDGFYSNLTLIPNDKNILITGINSKKYLLYNLDTMKLTKEQDSYIDVANIIILDKSQRL